MLPLWRPLLLLSLLLHLCSVPNSCYICGVLHFCFPMSPHFRVYQHKSVTAWYRSPTWMPLVVPIKLVVSVLVLQTLIRVVFPLTLGLECHLLHRWSFPLTIKVNRLVCWSIKWQEKIFSLLSQKPKNIYIRLYIRRYITVAVLIVYRLYLLRKTVRYHEVVQGV